MDNCIVNDIHHESKVSLVCSICQARGYERFALDIKFIMGVHEGPSWTIGYLPFYQEINRPIDIEQAVIFRHSCLAEQSICSAISSLVFGLYCNL